MDLLQAVRTLLETELTTHEVHKHPAKKAYFVALAQCDDPDEVFQAMRLDAMVELPLPIWRAAFERILELTDRAAEMLRSYAFWLESFYRPEVYGEHECLLMEAYEKEIQGVSNPGRFSYKWANKASQTDLLDAVRTMLKPDGSKVEYRVAANNFFGALAECNDADIVDQALRIDMYCYLPRSMWCAAFERMLELTNRDSELAYNYAFWLRAFYGPEAYNYADFLKAEALRKGYKGGSQSL